MEKKTTKNKETVTFFGEDMIINVYNEHGEIDNPQNPACAHLKKADGTFLGKFLITDQPPADKTSVVDCYTEPETGKIIPIPSEYKEKMVKWAAEKYRADDDGKISNWSVLQLLFDMLIPENQNTYPLLSDYFQDIGNLFQDYFEIGIPDFASSLYVKKYAKKIQKQKQRAYENIRENEKALAERIQTFLNKPLNEAHNYPKEIADPKTISNILALHTVLEFHRINLYDKDEVPLMNSAIQIYKDIAIQMNNFLVRQNKKTIQGKEQLLLIFDDNGNITDEKFLNTFPYDEEFLK